MTKPADNREPSLAEDRLWKVADVVRFLGMSEAWVRREQQEGRLPYVKLGGHAIRFMPEKIKAWAEAQAHGKVLAFSREG